MTLFQPGSPRRCAARDDVLLQTFSRFVQIVGGGKLPEGLFVQICLATNGFMNSFSMAKRGFA
jgi:hypothetical protein